ncbi:submaxillary gland androgen-regulated protein 3A-like [Apodemus sylvaticus]|uniref:submaxillary gland androgen-regulated protein 3A-like n=1 Tax=Apodemus sylvaticus TaxID=10129 RepID=UPI002241E662|nr:submaxillary gland androgen-regulated protein 3A-like [Apodemus sylvaticus]
MKPLYLVFDLWILTGCFLSGECHRGPRGQHEPRGPLTPSTPPPHLHPQLDHNTEQNDLPPDTPPREILSQTSSIFVYVTVLFLGPIYSQPPPPPPPPIPSPPLGFHPSYIQTSPHPIPPHNVPAQTPPSNPPTQPPPTVQANVLPAANISITNTTTPNSTDTF